MFIVTDADPDFLAPLDAAYKLSAGTFHPYGVRNLWSSYYRHSTPTGFQGILRTFLRRRVAGDYRLKSRFDHTR